MSEYIHPLDGDPGAYIIDPPGMSSISVPGDPRTMPEETLRLLNAWTRYQAALEAESTTTTVYDVNQDGQVTSADVTALQQRLVSNDTSAAYDYNDDGQVDVVDVQWLQANKVSGSSESDSGSSTAPDESAGSSDGAGDGFEGALPGPTQPGFGGGPRIEMTGWHAYAAVAVVVAVAWSALGGSD